MEISISNQDRTLSRTVDNSIVAEGQYSKWIKSLNPYYFGLIAFTITFGSILGSITAMYISQNNAPIWHMSLCIALAMTNNVMAIGQAPTKWVVNTFMFAILVELILIAVNFG